MSVTNNKVDIAPVMTLAAGQLCDTSGADWAKFVASWADLPQDQHMADGGRYRQRRHAVFGLANGTLARLADRPHFQEWDYNALNGGIERRFAPIERDVADLVPFRSIILRAAALIEAQDAPGPDGWTLEAHQFRISATGGQPGLPTPEGMHSDGRDWVLILLIGSDNVTGGVTCVEDRQGAVLLDRPLETDGEALLLDDRRVRHSTSAISQASQPAPAWRDTLVITFARASS